MLVKTIISEDFINYKKASMFIGTCYCNWKCCKENNLPITICQNHLIDNQKNIEISNEDIYKRYSDNPITSAIVIGGLEPFLQFDEIYELIKYIREYSYDDIVIYTGYYPNELEDEIKELKSFINIIIKFGRYIPNNSPHYDDVLGINLISDNQFAIKIS